MADPKGTISYDITFSGGPSEEKFYCDINGIITVTSGTLAVDKMDLKVLIDKLTQWLLQHKMATMTVVLNS